jgi:hypothetical protein
VTYQRKKRKVRSHRQPDRVAMAKSKRERKKTQRAADPEVQFRRRREETRQQLLTQLKEAKSHPARKRIKAQLELL